MKSIILIIILIAGATAIFAQGSLALGQSQLNVGLGLSGWGVPVYLGFDHGISRDVTLGAEVSFRSVKRTNSGDHSIVGLSGNANYHFNRVLDIPSNWDFYAGLNIGYFIVSNSDPNSSYYSRLGVAGQIGGRYYLSNSVGVNLEFGGGNAFSGGKLGLTFKL